jgi:acyl-CoA synthetase (AMP-forming)/AMP-acid ligase II
VMITHANLQAMSACCYTDIDQVEADTHWLYAAPISHAAGLYGLPHFLKGARHVVPVSEKFDPAEILELGRSLEKLSLFAAPTMVRRLVDLARQTGDRGSGIRSIVYGGGPMYVADLLDGMEQFGSKFVQLYGQGESPMTITALSRDDHSTSFAQKDFHRLGSVGRAQSLVEVRTVLGDGRPAAAGETGEILVRGPTVMAGYWNNPEATVEAIRAGWLHTGDLGAMDAAGYLTLKDRSKDLIISGGSNIYPREIEEILLTHEAVSEVAVIGIPDPEWGEVPIACYTCRPGYAAAAAELEKLCTENIARFKRPRDFRLLQALPKNSYGKILKTDLRSMLEASVP